MELTRIHRQILLAAKREMDAVAVEPGPGYVPSWVLAAREEQLEHGPEYKPGDWFGGHSNAERQAWLRGVYALEEAGLLETWRRYDAKITNLKLTPEGIQAAEDLLAVEGAKTVQHGQGDAYAEAVNREAARLSAAGVHGRDLGPIPPIEATEAAAAEPAAEEGRPAGWPEGWQ